MDNLKKRANETENMYLWRVDNLIREGVYRNWKEVIDDVNFELFGDNEDEYYSESTPRKRCKYARDMYEDVFSKFVDDQYFKEVQIQKDELFKVKKQMQDQRREYNKILISDSRDEHLRSEIEFRAREMKNFIPLDFSKTITETSNKDAVLFFSDWHYGMVTENIWNTYDTKICKQRVKEVVERASEYIRLNKCENLHVVVLGDLPHGAIHTGCRVASEEDTCDQLVHVAEILSEAIGELSRNVAKTYVHTTYGNHARTIQNKHDSKHSDNMEKIIPWWMKERFSDRDDIIFADSSKYEFILFNVRGKQICCTHGDLEKNLKQFGANMNMLFTRKYNIQIDYAIMGDKHHMELFDSFGIESKIVSSLCGSDEYANNGRLYGKAGQTLMIFNDRGRESVYDIVVS